MSILDIFKRRKGPSGAPVSPASQPIPEEERQYYRPDEYYQQGRLDGQPVVTFEQRKEMAYPSKRGLYPAEILLLAYCEYGTYPNPKNGYPGFWWFEYGIRNVGAVLQSLEERGFLRFVTKSVRDTRLVYTPTREGRIEIEENQYVKYLHDHRNDFALSLWDMNRELHDNPDLSWEDMLNRHLDRLLAQCRQSDDVNLDGMDLRQKSNELQRYIGTQRIIDSCKEAGITRFMFLATLDLRTCRICARRDLRPCTEHSAPPCHPGCRCTIMPQTNAVLLHKLKRFARDPITGKGIDVPGDMDYNRWYLQYVAGNATAQENKRKIDSGVSSDPYQETLIRRTIADHPGILQSQLADVAGIPKSTAIMWLNKLVGEGKVKKEKAGRSFSLHLKEDHSSQ